MIQGLFLKEKINFESTSQSVNDQEIVKILDNELYKTNFHWFNKTTYVIKTEENFINIDPDQEEFILLLEKDVGKYKQKI